MSSSPPHPPSPTSTLFLSSFSRSSSSSSLVHEMMSTSSDIDTRPLIAPSTAVHGSGGSIGQPPPSNGFRRALAALNPNVRTSLVFTLLFRVSTSLSLTMLATVYLYKITNSSNTAVGLVTGLNGLANIGCAVPAGYYADKLSRQLLLRISAVVALLAAALTILAVLLDSIPLIAAFFFLWGAAEGLQSSPLSSLFADSIATGARSSMFSAQYAIQEGASFVGPALSIALFAVYGDTWDLVLLRAIIIAGAVIGALAYLLLFAMRDVASLGHESEAADLAALASADKTMDHAGGSEGPQSDVSCGCVTPAYVPYVLATSDLTFSLGAGITVAYFPLFFLNLGLTPMQMSAVIILGSLATVVVVSGGQRVSRFAGRIQISILTKAIGIACLVVLSLVKPVWLIVILYAARVAFSRCGVPLDRSVVMDVVGKDTRARWNVIEAIGAVSFTGSAAVGGVLIDHTSYVTAFRITAAVYVVATAIIVPITPFVPKKEAKLLAVA